MQKFELNLIRDAFKRCYGLASFVVKERVEAFEIIASQTGLRLDYLKKHHNEVMEIAEIVDANT